MKRLQVTSLLAAIAVIALQLLPAQQADARYHHHHYRGGYGYGNNFAAYGGNGYGYGNGYGGGYGGGYGHGYGSNHGGFNHRQVGFNGSHGHWR